MDQLSGLDAACLHIETPSTPMNVMAVVRLDGKKPGFATDLFLAHLEARVKDLAPLRRRLIDSVLGLDRPQWVECREVPLHKHVRIVTAPTPGGERELAQIAAEQAMQPLDRSRPLWRLTIVEGLQQAQVGLIMIIHHAVADGISGAALLTRLLEDGPNKDVPPVEEAPQDRRKNTFGRLLHSLGDRPARVTQAASGTAAAAERLGNFALGPGRSLIDTSPFAPKSRLSGPIGAERIVAWSRTKRAALEWIREKLGGTLNDVVLAACTESLRQYLLRHAELPDQPLIAAVPVSVRRSCESSGFGNRISALLIRLPVHLEEPFDQLIEIQHESRRAKQVHHAIGGDTLGHLAELTSDGMLRAGVQIAEQLGAAQWVPPIANVAISNVPGPREPLYAAGARVASVHPHGPLLAAIRVNITVMTYLDSVDFGLIACRESLPDAEQIAQGFSNGIDALTKAALGENPAKEPFEKLSAT
jgi:diacylglycerol O-acyltransferase